MPNLDDYEEKLQRQTALGDILGAGAALIYVGALLLAGYTLDYMYIHLVMAFP